MSLIKFNDPFRFPWNTSALTNFLGADDFFMTISLQKTA